MGQQRITNYTAHSIDSASTNFQGIKKHKKQTNAKQNARRNKTKLSKVKPLTVIVWWSCIEFKKKNKVFTIREHIVAISTGLSMSKSSTSWYIMFALLLVIRLLARCFTWLLHSMHMCWIAYWLDNLAGWYLPHKIPPNSMLLALDFNFTYILTYCSFRLFTFFLFSSSTLCAVNKDIVNGIYV